MAKKSRARTLRDGMCVVTPNPGVHPVRWERMGSNGIGMESGKDWVAGAGIADHGSGIERESKSPARFAYRLSCTHPGKTQTPFPGALRAPDARSCLLRQFPQYREHDKITIKPQLFGARCTKYTKPSSFKVPVQHLGVISIAYLFTRALVQRSAFVRTSALWRCSYDTASLHLSSPAPPAAPHSCAFFSQRRLQRRSPTFASSGAHGTALFPDYTDPACVAPPASGKWIVQQKRCKESKKDTGVRHRRTETFLFIGVMRNRRSREGEKVTAGYGRMGCGTGSPTYGCRLEHNKSNMRTLTGGGGDEARQLSHGAPPACGRAHLTAHKASKYSTNQRHAGSANKKNYRGFG
eukprot:gene10539-biopygen1769